MVAFIVLHALVPPCSVLALAAWYWFRAYLDAGTCRV